MKLNEVHERAMDDARRYTSALIIAQRMILDGFTYETAHKVMAKTNDPLHCNILNAIRDITINGLLVGQSAKRLKQLAKQLR